MCLCQSIIALNRGHVPHSSHAISAPTIQSVHLLYKQCTYYTNSAPQYTNAPQYVALAHALATAGHGDTDRHATRPSLRACGGGGCHRPSRSNGLHSEQPAGGSGHDEQTHVQLLLLRPNLYHPCLHRTCLCYAYRACRHEASHMMTLRT